MNFKSLNLATNSSVISPSLLVTVSWSERCRTKLVFSTFTFRKESNVFNLGKQGIQLCICSSVTNKVELLPTFICLFIGIPAGITMCVILFDISIE